MVREVIEELGRGVGVVLSPVRVVGDEMPSPNTAFRVVTAATAAVGAATAAIGLLARQRFGGELDVEVDAREAWAAFLDERYFQVDGVRPTVWAELSGDYRTADGWVRLHCNFGHHRDAALRALGLAPGAGRVEVEAACGRRGALEIEDAVTEEQGCAAAMRSRAEWAGHPQGRAVAAEPLIGVRRLDDGGGPVAVGRGGREDHRGIRGDRRGQEDGGDGPGGGGAVRELEGVRVLDLTRVIAGPVAGRVLAGFGAEVLRVGAAHLPEVDGVVLCTGFGKRSCELDLRTEEGRAALWRLVAGADVVVRGYRPGALERWGFGVKEISAARPGVVCVDVSAYGGQGPWGTRRGFDSLVQMVSGIAHEGGGGARPVPLPAQVLDHATGWLAAFGAVAGLSRGAAEGGSWHVEVSLARTARWLDGLGRDVPGEDVNSGDLTAGEVNSGDLMAEDVNVGGFMARDVDSGDLIADGVDADLMQGMDSASGRLTYVRQPGMINRRRPYWASPPPLRGEHPPSW